MQFRAYQPVEVEFDPGKLDRLEAHAPRPGERGSRSRSEPHPADARDGAPPDDDVAAFGSRPPKRHPVLFGREEIASIVRATL